MHDFTLTKLDSKMLKAAIEFGSWIASRKETTTEKKRDIADVLQLLESAPSSHQHVGGSFGIEVVEPFIQDELERLTVNRNRPERAGFHRAWSVLYYTTEGGIPTIEMQHKHMDRPRRSRDDEAKNELSHLIKAAGSTYDKNEPVDSDHQKKCERWVAQLEQIEKELKNGRIVNVGTTFNETATVRG